jgi:hypothetical protein
MSNAETPHGISRFTPLSSEMVRSLELVCGAPTRQGSSRNLELWMLNRHPRHSFRADMPSSYCLDASTREAKAACCNMIIYRQAREQGFCPRTHSSMHGRMRGGPISSSINLYSFQRGDNRSSPKRSVMGRPHFAFSHIRDAETTDGWSPTKL